MTTIHVDIWSDVACPWCCIGTRRFEAGVRQFLASEPQAEVEVTGNGPPPPPSPIPRVELIGDLGGTPRHAWRRSAARA